MAWRPRSLGLLLLLYAAALGYALVVWAPDLFDRYERVAARHPALGYAYLTAVVVGGLLLGVVSVVIFVRLWRNTAAKNRQRERRMANPSELSSKERLAELADNLTNSQSLAEDEHASQALR